MIPNSLSPVVIATGSTVVGMVATFATVAQASTAQFDFAYELDFVSSVVSESLGLSEGDLLSGFLLVEEENVAPTGLSSLQITPDSDTEFSFAIDGFILDASDDLFGGPIVDFVDGDLDSIFFDAAVEASDGQSFLVSLTDSFFGDPEVLINLSDSVDPAFGAVGSLITEADSASVPEPVSILGLSLLGLAWLGKRQFN